MENDSMKKKNKLLEEADRIDDDFSFDYPEEIKTPSGSSNVFRIVGGSESFEKYWISWWLCDDEKIRSFIIENSFEGRSILAEILGDQNNWFEGGYLESKKGQYGKINTYQSKNPELWKRVVEYWNPAFMGTSSARPRKEYVFNAIHRNPVATEQGLIDWCVANKHTKLIRFGQQAFKKLAIIFENHGEFEEYDIIFSKKGTGRDTVQSIIRAGKNTKYAKIGILADEEKKYERYDLKDVAKLSSAHYILKYLENTISQIDNVMGTSYLAKLNQIANAVESEAENQLFDEKQQLLQSQQPQQSQQAVNQNIAVPQDSVENAASIFSDTDFPPFPEIPEKKQSNSPSTISDQKKMDKKDGNIPTILCKNCNTHINRDEKICPRCGNKLVVKCEICNNIIPAHAITCPFCGVSFGK